MKSLDADIIVVGAGLVGLAAAIAFAKQNKQVVLLNTQPKAAKKSEVNKQAAWDERIYALTPSTETWLRALEVWQHVDLSRANAIHTMHLWDEASDEPLKLSDNDANLPKLGLIIENKNLIQALWQQIDALGVTLITDAKCKFLENTKQHVQLGLKDGTIISAKLLVAADGVNSWVRQQANITVKQKDFQETAIVANFLAEKNHRNIARQWFASHETLALLPLPDKYVSMVWSVSTERANELLKLPSGQLAAAVQVQSRGVLGELKQIGNHVSFKLNQQTATSLIAERVVLVGDAAHQIHPMAGQGMNLGFRDVMQLASSLIKINAMQDIGERTFLRQYERVRKTDIVTMNSLTSGLDNLFASDSKIIKKLTNWGLRQLNSQATLKKILIQQAAT